MSNSFRIFLIFFLYCFQTFSAVPALEREVSLVLRDEKISEALLRIHQQTGVVFSYQPALISDAAPVSLELRQKTVREALTVLLPRHITFKSRENYVILKERPVEKQKNKTQVSGYVYDSQTEKKIPNVTIYDKNSLQSVTTDEFGYYSITVPAESPALNVNKEEYADTVITMATLPDDQLVNIRIDPLQILRQMKDSLQLKETFSEVKEYSTKLLRRFRGYVHTVNVKDTIHRKFQFSVFPFIGTNHRLSGIVYNEVSLNLYGGYARGLNGFEAAGLFNIEKENVKGVQLAGFFNLAGDSVKGTQLAGLMNLSGRSAEGFQAAGLMNINEGRSKGFKAAGLMNISGATEGAGAAGLMNISGKARGVQLAGLANVQDTLEGISISGLFNVNDQSTSGSQLAGLFNVSTRGTTRFQLAGLFNDASHVKGLQLAPLNFADSSSGVPIGLLSFVKTGIHQLEISADEIFYTNLSLRTGVNAFYNIVTIGVQPGSARPLWQIGYGLGSSLKLNSKWRGDLNFSVQHISKGDLYLAASELYKAYLGLEYRLGKKFSIAAGPTFNLYITDALMAGYSSDYSAITPFSLRNYTDSYDYNRKSWIGARVALRFF